MNCYNIRKSEIFRQIIRLGKEKYCIMLEKKLFATYSDVLPTKLTIVHPHPQQQQQHKNQVLRPRSLRGSQSKKKWLLELAHFTQAKNRRIFLIILKFLGKRNTRYS